jgi:hypothetical protein
LVLCDFVYVHLNFYFFRGKQENFIADWKRYLKKFVVENLKLDQFFGGGCGWGAGMFAIV